MYCDDGIRILAPWWRIVAVTGQAALVLYLFWYCIGFGFLRKWLLSGIAPLAQCRL
jgi:hypothetical protein